MSPFHSINRRGFLLRTGKILAGTGLAVGLQACRPEQQTAPPAADTAPAGSDDYSPFHMGFQSYSLRHFQALDDFIREAAKLRLNYVELYRGHLATDASPDQILEVKERLAAAGLKVNAFGVEGFSADDSANRALFEFGKALGVNNLSADPTKDAFPSLERLVAEYDIRIAIHNHGPEDERWRRPDWILESIGELDPRIGSCTDTGHFIRAGVEPAEAIEMLGSRVLGVHLKDFDSEGNDVVLGEGRLDLEKTLAALKNVGFSGPLSLEFEGDAENPVPKMLESLRRIREFLAA